eukprot:1193131-Prorocentrum_minimum.AAC.2
MIHSIAEHVPEGSKVLELFAGAGGIGLSLAAAGRAASVRCAHHARPSRYVIYMRVHRSSYNTGTESSLLREH